VLIHYIKYDVEELSLGITALADVCHGLRVCSQRVVGALLTSVVEDLLAHPST
jgi:hypothetical protein